MTGYTIFRRDRPTNGGGVLLAIKDDHPVTFSDPYFCPEGELVSLVVTFPAQPKMSVVCYYRPPSRPDFDDIQTWTTETTTSQILMTGDFNMPGIDWPKGIVSSLATNTALQQRFIQFTQTNNLRQHITTPTHTKGNTLDLLLHNTETNIQIIGLETGYSDHTAIISTIPQPPTPSKPRKPPPKQIFTYDTADTDALEQDLCGLHSRIQHMCTMGNKTYNTDDIWHHFKNSLITAAQQHIPQRTLHRNNKPWVNHNTVKAIRKKRRLHKTYMTHRTPQNKNKLHQQNKACKQMLNEDYNNHLNSRISSALAQNNPKPLYKFISDKRNTHNTIKTLDGCDPDPDRPDQLAQTFAEAFASVFTPDDSLLPTTNQTSPTMTDSITFTAPGILTQLLHLDPRKAQGPDKLSPSLLKFLAPHISSSMALIFQHSLDTGEVPTDWRTANVVPIHKKGSRSNPLNYRPISLTSITSKIIEHVIAHHIRHHLDTNSLLSTNQHGFRRDHSCDSQLLSTSYDLINNFDNNIRTDLIILDFAKAFDTVSYPKLIHKLGTFGLHPLITRWIQSWLEDRTFSVVMKGSSSQPTPVTSGVPQGSVLGPLLFLLFINDLPKHIKSPSCIRLFADDALIYRQIKDQTDCTSLQQDLDEVCGWANTWQMRFNVSKCETASIHRSKSPPHTYNMNHIPLKQVTAFKYLGVTFTDNLSFDTHVTNITRKANGILHMLIRTLHKTSTRTKTLAFTTICRPILEYASPVWSPHKTKLIKHIENIQRKAYRWAHNIPRTDHISSRMAVDGWLPLQQRRQYKDLNMGLQIRQGTIAIDKTLIQQNTSHNTRAGTIREHIHTNTKKHSFFNRII